MEGGRWREIAPMHARSLLSRFASSPLRPSSRDLVGELNDVAVLAIDGLALLEDRSFPREIALAFWGDRQDLAWLVRPEAVWSEDGSAAPAGPLGLGLPPSIVAAELAAACVGLRVFVEHHLATSAWLKRMFAAAEGVMPFPIRDLRQLVLPLSRRLPECGAGQDRARRDRDPFAFSRLVACRSRGGFASALRQAAGDALMNVFSANQDGFRIASSRNAPELGPGCLTRMLP
jgi:hypothetical protein